MFRFSNLKNVGYLLFLTLAIFIYGFIKSNYLLFIVVLFLLILYLVFHKTLFWYSLLFIFISFLFIFIYRTFIYENKDQTIDDTFFIYKTVDYEEYQKVYVKKGLKKYYFINTKQLLNSGYHIRIKGSVFRATPAHLPNGYNTEEYLYHNLINGKIQNTQVIYIKKTFSWYRLHELLVRYIKNNYPKCAHNILSALTIGEKIKDNEELSNNIRLVGIGHLFVISGLHMGIISNALKKLLRYFKVKDLTSNITIVCCLCAYYILAGGIVSILRVIISFVLNNLLGKMFKMITPLDKLSLNASIVLLINPFYLFSFSYRLSYMVVLGIILISSLLKTGKTVKNIMVNNLMISATSLIITLPLILNISCEINILSVIYNLFFIPVVTYILLPLSFIVLLLPFLKTIYAYIVISFENLLKILNKIPFLKFTLVPFNVFLMFAYYLCFILIIRSKNLKKRIIYTLTIIFIIFLQNTKLSFNIYDEIYFLDLPIGEAILIKEHHNKNNILIDTGDVDANSLITFLNYCGIKKLNAIFISHSDSDHIGGLSSIINYFKVDNIYISRYDPKKEEISKRYKNVVLLKKGDELSYDNITFKIIWPQKEYQKINNNSLVFYANIHNLTILFTGDIEKEAEDALYKDNTLKEVDILKVAHHGSKTSSTLTFLKKVNPNFALALNGYLDKFGFPSNEVVNRFESIGIPMLNTKEYGTIILYKKYYEKEYKIKSTFTYSK